MRNSTTCSPEKVAEVTVHVLLFAEPGRAVAGPRELLRADRERCLHVQDRAAAGAVFA